MAWTRIDDKFLNNIKIRKVGALGMALYLAGLIHCNTNLTDGFIDDAALPLLYGLSFQNAEDDYAKKLVKAGLWHKVAGGYEVNDFLDFNRSKEQIETIKAKRAESGSKGGSKPRAKEEAMPKQIAKPELKINTLIPNTLIKQQPPQLARNAFSLYQDGIGYLNAHMAEVIKLAIEEFTDEWVVAAIESAIEQNTCKWSYVDAILKRWKVDGFKVDTRQPKATNKRNGNGSRNRKPDMGNYEVDRSGETVVVDDGTEVEGELQF